MTAEKNQNGIRRSTSARNPAISDAATNPIVPAPPKTPWAVDDRPGGLPAAALSELIRTGLGGASSDVLGPLAVLGIWGVGAIALAVRTFRWE